jgi:hypothetical protein
MNPMVTAGLLALLPELEGRIPYMYLDRKQIVTVGIGCVLAGAGVAEDLPFQRRDGSRAGRDEIRAAFNLVVSRSDLAGLYAQFATVTALRLSDSAMVELCLRRIAACETEARRWFDDLDTWPLDAQMGVMIMIFGLGSNISRFPRFRRACREKDWPTAGEQSHWLYQRPDRTRALRTCFSNAAVATASNYPPILFFPASLSASAA